MEIPKRHPIPINVRSKKVNHSIGFHDHSRLQALQQANHAFSALKEQSDSLYKASVCLTPMSPNDNGYDFTQIPLPKPNQGLKPKLFASQSRKLKNERKVITEHEFNENSFGLRSYLSPVGNSHQAAFRKRKQYVSTLKTESDDYSKYYPGLSHSSSSKSILPLHSTILDAALPRNPSMDKLQKAKSPQSSNSKAKLYFSKQLSPLNKTKITSSSYLKTESDTTAEPLIIQYANDKISTALKYKLDTNLLSPIETPLKQTRIPNNSSVKSPKHKHLRAITERSTILVLFDDNLEFIKDYLNGFHFSAKFIYKKIEQYEYLLLKKEESEACTDSLKKPNRLPHYAIFCFLKFSPGISEKKFAVIQELLKENSCYIVKCNPFGDFSNLDLEYESEEITIERKRNIEHQLNLTHHQSGVYRIEYENFNKLGNFLNLKLSSFVKKMKTIN